MSGFLETATLCYAQDVTCEHTSAEQNRLHLVTSEMLEVAERWAKPDTLRSRSDTRPVAWTQFLQCLCDLYSLGFIPVKMSFQNDTKLVQVSNAVIKTQTEADWYCSVH